MRSGATVLVLASAFIFSACPARDDTRATDLGVFDRVAATGELQRVRNDYLDAFNARDATRLADLFDEDAVLSRPNAEPVRGRDNIRIALERDAVQFTNIHAEPEVSHEGDGWAVEFGTVTVGWGGGAPAQEGTAAQPGAGQAAGMQRPTGAPDQIRSSYAVLLVRDGTTTWGGPGAQQPAVGEPGVLQQPADQPLTPEQPGMSAQDGTWRIQRMVISADDRWQGGGMAGQPGASGPR
jgi:hypothetical protein